MNHATFDLEIRYSLKLFIIEPSQLNFNPHKIISPNFLIQEDWIKEGRSYSLSQIKNILLSDERFCFSLFSLNEIVKSAYHHVQLLHLMRILDLIE